LCQILSHLSACITVLVNLFSCLRYGRRFVTLLSLFLQFLFGVGVAFSPNIYVYIALRFVVGTTISGITMNTFVLGNTYDSFLMPVAYIKKLDN